MRTITILWEDLLATKMFIKFWKDSFARSLEPQVISLNYMFSREVNISIFQSAQEEKANLLFVTYKVAKNTPNLAIPGEVLEGSDVVVRVDRDNNMQVVKLAESDASLPSLWGDYLKHLTGV